MTPLNDELRQILSKLSPVRRAAVATASAQRLVCAVAPQEPVRGAEAARLCEHLWEALLTKVDFGTLVKAAFLSVLVSSKAMASQPSSFEARVINVSDFPSAGSGYTVTWISIQVIGDLETQSRELLTPYVSDKQQLPSPGDHCLFNVHDGSVGGSVGGEMRDTKEATIIDSFRCGTVKVTML